MPSLPPARTGLLAVALAAALAPAPAAHAAGFYLQEQSVRAIGRAFSGETADTGPESLWWNPASIAGEDRPSAYVGVSDILPSGTVSDRGTVIIRPGQAPAGVGGEPVAHNPLESGAVPSGAVAVPIGSQFALGLAITSPFSFTTQYDALSWTRYSALRTRLRTFDLQPSVAFAPTPWLKLGAALNAEHADATLSNALPNLSPLLPDGTETLKGNGWNYGWSAGVQLIHGPVTFGVSYKSRIGHTLNGAVTIASLLGPLAPQNATISTAASFSTPWQVIFGARVRATDRLTLDAEAVRLGWSEFDAIRLGAPINAALPQGYRDTWSVAFGADYLLQPDLTLRAGIQWDETPTVDGQRDTRVPDASRLNFAIGTTWQATHAVSLDLAAAYIHFNDSSIDRPTAAYVGTPVQTPILTLGQHSGAHAFIIASGVKFRF
jgi:long-chain fatty acid transport protein